MHGHGKSTFSKSGWTLDEIAENFYDFIKSNNIRRPILIRQSQGEMVFMRLAIKFPDLVGGLILIGTSSKAEYKDRLPFWKEAVQILNSENETNINNLLEQIQKNVVSEYFLKNSIPQATHELKMMQSHHPIGLKLSTEAAVLNRKDVSGEIHKIKCKTLIVCGKDYHTTPYNISELMKIEIGEAEL